jgi:hypothetical protein
VAGLIFLAGPLFEAAADEPPTGRMATHAERAFAATAHIVGAPQSLSTSDLRMLVAGDDPNVEHLSDLDGARMMATLLVGKSLRDVQVRLWQGQAAELVGRLDFRCMGHALASALLERETLTAADTRRILRAAERAFAGKRGL